MTRTEAYEAVVRIGKQMNKSSYDPNASADLSLLHRAFMRQQSIIEDLNEEIERLQGQMRRAG